MNKQKRLLKHYLILILIFLTFATPIVLAYVFYRYVGDIHFSHTNHGELINPPLNLVTQYPLKKWRLLYVGHDCDELCQRELHTLKQLHIAFGKEQKRVVRVLALTKSQLSSEVKEHYPHLQLSTIDNKTFQQLQMATHSNVEAHIFVLDPHGNAVMYFKNANKPREIYIDLKHLLKASEIG